MNISKNNNEGTSVALANPGPPAAARAGESTAEKPYVLGTDQNELMRLGLQHQLWSEQVANGWDRAGFRWGDRILDAGCGPGYATFDLARLVGHVGRVIAVDKSSRFLDHLSRQIAAQGVSNIEVHPGDVEKLDLDPASLDGAYARWILCFVRKPAAVLRGVARALKPGATFLIHDYYRYEGIHIAPSDPVFERIFRAVAESWRIRGGDSNIGSRLVPMLAAEGFVIQHLRPLVRMARPNQPFWSWPNSFFSNYLPVLVEMALITRRDATLFARRWAERSADPHAFFSSPPMIEIIASKA